MTEETGAAIAAEDAKTPDAAKTSGDWRSGLSDDIRDNDTLAKYDSIEKLAASHINLQAHLGRDKIAKPVTDDDWENVYNFLGRPEKPDAYEVKIADDLPDEAKAGYDDASMTAFKAKAHELGLSQKQIQGVLDFHGGTIAKQISALKEAQATALEDGERALAKEWGRAFRQNAKFAEKALFAFGGEELADLMDQSGLGNHPAVVKAFANIAKATMADKDLAGPAGGGRGIPTPQEARAEASRLMAHPAYLDDRHPEHKAMVRKVASFFEKAHENAEER